MKKKKNWLKKVILFILIIYACITIINQQKILNNYKEQASNLEIQIAEAEEYQEQLNLKKENINSAEYIEATAREKLGMYLPNERVYLDNEN